MSEWFWNPHGILPWFEANQGVLSVVALCVALFALIREAQLAHKAEKKAADLQRETDAKAAARDRQALIEAEKQSNADRLAATRREAISYNNAVLGLVHDLLHQCDTERNRLEGAEENSPVRPAIMANANRCLGALKALLGGAPRNAELIMGTVRAIEDLETFSNLPFLMEKAVQLRVIDAHITALNAALAILQREVNWLSNPENAELIS